VVRATLSAKQAFAIGDFMGFSFFGEAWIRFSIRGKSFRSARLPAAV